METPMKRFLRFYYPFHHRLLQIPADRNYGIRYPECAALYGGNLLQGNNK